MEVGRDLEAGGIDDAVHLVLHAVGDNTLRGDALDALGLAHVNERDVRPVERGQKLIVERRPLAHHSVPRLQGLCG